MLTVAVGTPAWGPMSNDKKSNVKKVSGCCKTCTFSLKKIKLSACRFCRKTCIQVAALRRVGKCGRTQTWNRSKNAAALKYWILRYPHCECFPSEAFVVSFHCEIFMWGLPTTNRDVVPCGPDMQMLLRISSRFDRNTLFLVYLGFLEISCSHLYNRNQRCKGLEKCELGSV